MFNKIIAKKIKYLSDLIRLDKPIGFLLLLWPCWFALANLQQNNLELIKWYIYFFFGAFLMRSAGCIVNDLIDINLDKKIERTAERPLTSKKVSIFEAIVLLFFFLLLSFYILLHFDFYAIIITVLFLYFEQAVPQFVMNTVMLLAYGMIVMILMSLGVALSRLKVFAFKETFIYSFIRIIIGPIVGLAFVKFFNLSGVEAGVMFIQASMPSAVLTFLISEIYAPKKISNSIASTVALSTFMSFFTLIFVVFIALKYFN